MKIKHIWNHHLVIQKSTSPGTLFSFQFHLHPAAYRSHKVLQIRHRHVTCGSASWLGSLLGTGKTPTVEWVETIFWGHDVFFLQNSIWSWLNCAATRSWKKANTSPIITWIAWTFTSGDAKEHKHNYHIYLSLLILLALLSCWEAWKSWSLEVPVTLWHQKWILKFLSDSCSFAECFYQTWKFQSFPLKRVLTLTPMQLFFPRIVPDTCLAYRLGIWIISWMGFEVEIS